MKEFIRKMFQKEIENVIDFIEKQLEEDGPEFSHVKDLFEELKVLDLKIPNNIEVAKNILNQILLELE
jgi:hypothetical protein